MTATPRLNTVMRALENGEIPVTSSRHPRSTMPSRCRSPRNRFLVAAPERSYDGLEACRKITQKT